MGPEDPNWAKVRVVDDLHKGLDASQKQSDDSELNTGKFTR